MIRRRGVGQRPKGVTRLPRASELQESLPALDRSLALLLFLEGSRRVSIPPVPVPATWRSRSPSPFPLLLASRSPGTRDLECVRHDNYRLALFSELPSWAIHFTGALKCTEDCHVFEIAGSAPRCTRTTLEGVKCHNSSGAKHRSCIAARLDTQSRLYRPHRRRGFHAADD